MSLLVLPFGSTTTGLDLKRVLERTLALCLASPLQFWASPSPGCTGVGPRSYAPR